MTRSNPSERRSRRRSANHPSTPLSATAENRRKRRLMASRKRSPNPNGPVAPPQGREGQPNRRITHPAQTTAYPPVPPFPAPSTNAAPPAYYLPPAPPYPESSSQSYPNQGGQPNGTSRGATKDIHFGPSPRRRHELSSNPAFGQSRQRQRHGQSKRRQSGVNSGHSTMAQPRNPKTVDLAAPGQHSPHLLRQPGTRQTGLSPVGPRPFGPATVSGQTVRTQSLQPRPVSRSRSGSRSGNRSAGGAIAPHPDAKRLAPSQSRALGRPKQRRRPPKPVSPVVYGLRLLILGTGVGVIAGTVISAFNPDQVMPTANMADVAALGPQAGNEGGTSRTASMGGMGEGLPASELAIAGMNTISKQKPYTELVRELEQMGQAQEGLIPSIFVLDLDTYNYVDVNGSTSFAAASTIKVPILVAFFQDVEQNKIDLDEMLTMTEEDIATGSGDMQYGTVGQQYSAIETATKMIVISDNTATNMLIRRLGGASALNQRFRSWGLNLTQIRNPLPDLDGTNTTSASELTHIMALVSEGKLLSLRSRDRMLDIMYRTMTNTLLPSGIGDNAAIAHKTGDIGSMVGDTGLVDTPNGKRYAITILMGRPHNDGRAQELIRRMTERIHTVIQEPPVEPVPVSPNPVNPVEGDSPPSP